MERGPAAGEVQLLDGYFVHFTAPEKLTPMAKHVVFVLDTSGSMRHRKMHQTIAAMVTILGDMRPEDSLTIVSFATEVTVWEGGSVVAASEDNIARAVRYVETLEAKGETNINGALLRALEILQEVRDTGARSELQPMVFFLTDGHPTVGETDTLAILDNIKTANANIGAPIFSLAFGRRTDFQMLRLLSVQNHGFARKIYTAADASLQMAGFYKEVSSPILSNVTFDYLSSDIIHDSLTETAFHTFYQGGEMVVAGMVDTHQHAVDTMVMSVFEVRHFTMEYIYIYIYNLSTIIVNHAQYEITAHHTGASTTLRATRWWPWRPRRWTPTSTWCPASTCPPTTTWSACGPTSACTRSCAGSSAASCTAARRSRGRQATRCVQCCVSSTT